MAETTDPTDGGPASGVRTVRSTRRRSATGPASAARVPSACATSPSTGTGGPTSRPGRARRSSSSTASATARTPGAPWSSSWPSTTPSSRPDLLGHGRSEKPRADYSVAGFANGMRDLLSVLEVDRVTVVGHSLGGGVAAQFAYQFPERCERLVLVGSGGVGRTVSPLLRVAAVPGRRGRSCRSSACRPIRFASRLGAELLRVFDTALGRDAEEILAVFDALPNTEARMAILRTLRSSVDWQGQVITMVDRAYLAEGVPTLIVWGRRDAIIPLGHGRLVHAVMPGQRARDLRRGGALPAPHRPGALRPGPARVRRALACRRASTRATWRERLRRGSRGLRAGDAARRRPRRAPCASSSDVRRAAARRVRRPAADDAGDRPRVRLSTR